MRHAGAKIIKNRIFLSIFAALLLYTLCGFFLAPVAIRWYIPRYTRKSLNCGSSIANVRVNPLLLTVEAKGLRLDQPDGAPLMSLKRMYISLKLSSLVHFRTIIGKLDMAGPVVHLEIEPNGRLNLDELLRTRKANSSPFPLVVRDLRIQGGELTIVDRRQSKPFSTTIGGLDIEAKDLSTLKDSKGAYSLRAAIGNGGTLHLEGTLHLSPLRSSGRLHLRRIRAETIFGFFRNRFRLAPPAGRLGVSASYQLNAATAPVRIALNAVDADLSNISLKLTNTDKPFLELKKVGLIASHLDVAKQDLDIRKLLVDGGRVDVEIDKGGRLNLGRIVRKAPAGSTPLNKGELAQAAASKSQAKFKADSVEIKDVALAFNDTSGQVPVRAAISSLDLNFKANLQAGPTEKETSLSEIAARLERVQVGAGRSPQSLFSADELSLEGGDCNLGDHSIALSRVIFDKGRLDLVRDREGRIDLLRLIGGAAKKNTTQRTAKGPASKWKLLVKSLEVQGYTSRISDLAANPNPLYTLKNIHAKATGVGGKSPFDFEAAFSVEQGGKVNIRGKVDPWTHSGKAEVDVRGLALTPLQPYLERSVNLVLRSAQLSSQGAFHYEAVGSRVKAVYDGSLGLNKLKFSQPHSNRTYLGCNSMEIPRLRLSLQPNVLAVPGMTVVKPVGELKIEPDRTLSLAEIFKHRPGGKATKRGGPNFQFTLSRIRIEQGDLSFVDSSLKPNFKALIHGLKGTVAGLSSQETSVAKMMLNGVVDRYGFVKINGVIRPHEFERLADIRMAFKNIEMKSFSPYSGKFAGRTIESGKLSANLNYKIHNARMLGDNHIILDNLLLGARVKTRSASDLPLDLVVALLKDPNGRIDIALPVEGNLNDPHFSFGPLVWEAVKGLIEKTVASPFRTIEALFGGKSKTPDLVEFDPGSTEIAPPEQEKLKSLAEAILKRPGLKLAIQATYSPDADGAALGKSSVRDAVVKRLGVRLSPGENPGPLDFADPKTQNILQKLYAARFGKPALDKLERGVEEGRIKPRISDRGRVEKAGKAGLLSTVVSDLELYKIIPGVKSPEQAGKCAAEEYERLVDSQKTPDEALIRIADMRARAVAGELEKIDGVPSGRLAIEKSKPQSGSAKPSVRLSLEALSS